MANIFRRTYTHTDSRTGKKQTKIVRKWYIDYRDANGVVQRVPGYTDKQATVQLAADLERRAARQQAGLVDPCADHARRPLTEHLDDYRRALESRGNDASYIAQTVAHCLAVFQAVGAVRPVDLDGDKAANWLLERRRAGLGPATSNRYLRSIKGFSGWMVKSSRSSADPFKRLSGVNHKTDVRRRRRVLADDECARFLESTGNSGRVFRGLTGDDRRCLYLAALLSGFRAAELASLFPGSFDLDANPPTATGEAGYMKNGQEAVQPLPMELATILRPFLAGRPASRPIWPGTWATAAWRMIRADLAEARAAWIAEAGADSEETERRETSGFLAYHADAGTVDFHSLRHSYISSLVRSGVHPKTAQTLARHATIGLTMDAYSHVRLHDQAAALEALPSLLPSAPPSQTVRATGTELAPVNVPLAVGLAVKLGALPHSDASIDTRGGKSAEKVSRRNHLENKPVSTLKHPAASERTHGGEGGRTPCGQTPKLTRTPHNRPARRRGQRHTQESSP
jgi:integrase